VGKEKDIKEMKRNNFWTASHLQTSAKSLLREVLAKAYKTLNPELNEDAILRYACAIGDYSHHSLVSEGERLLALMQVRHLNCFSFPEVPSYSCKSRVEQIDRLLA
jgi:hypothetical protein